MFIVEFAFMNMTLTQFLSLFEGRLPKQINTADDVKALSANSAV